MNKKERRAIVNNSLLDNPNMETQAKEKPHKIVLRTVFLVVLFALLFISYIFNFATDLYPEGLNTYCTAEFNVENHYNASSCDLIIIKPYKNINTAKAGDIICFSTNTEEGSGKLVSMAGEDVVIKLRNGETKTIKQVCIIGKQVEKVAVVGFFWAFLDSYIGIIVLSLIILAYVAFLTFSRINYENTEHGKKLYKRFRYKQAEERQRKKLLKEVRGIEGIDLKISQMLEGDFEQNKKKFLEFDYETKGKLKDKYKYILAEIHDAYLGKEDLSKEEKRRITSITELMTVPKDFDLDMEYMLIDLNLKTHLYDFDEDAFLQSSIEFIEGCDHKSDLINFGSVLYILVYKNSRIRDEKMVEIIKKYQERMAEFDKMGDSKQNDISKAILNLIKI